MKYKAKKSYFELKDKDNFIAFSSQRKHEQFLKGEEVEITSPPKKLMKHIEEVKDGRE